MTTKYIECCFWGSQLRSKCQVLRSNVGAVNIFTFPPLNVNWTFRWEGVRQWTLVRGILDKSRLMHSSYILCHVWSVSVNCDLS